MSGSFSSLSGEVGGAFPSFRGGESAESAAVASSSASSVPSSSFFSFSSFSSSSSAAFSPSRADLASVSVASSASSIGSNMSRSSVLLAGGGDAFSAAAELLAGGWDLAGRLAGFGASFDTAVSSSSTAVSSSSSRCPPPGIRGISTLNALRCIRDTTPTYHSAVTSDDVPPNAPPRTAFLLASASESIACSSIHAPGATPRGKLTRTNASKSRGSALPCAIAYATRAAASGNLSPCSRQCATSGATASPAAVSASWYEFLAASAHGSPQKWPAAPPPARPPCVGTRDSRGTAARGLRQW
mmetsp:Transcript_7761/g.30690  ORF Transcript_7761/g.30690 Transcript_7761/m.30690 type:complete len:300 (-) Transcript_7761:263-1162(-)